MTFIVAVDGPSGVGKSSVTKEVAQKKSMLYLDTGAIYRAVAYKAYEIDADFNNESILGEIAKNCQIKFNDDQIYLNDKNISTAIREPHISKIASAISQHKSVRNALLGIQRNIAKNSAKVILEGRDIGTVVFPHADLKIFITADAKVRAKRRWLQLKHDNSSSYEEILKNINQRDHADQNREQAPLKPAIDAILLDTTELSYREVVNKICQMIDQKGSNNDN